VRTKSSPTDPVTALDLEVERVIREHLGRLTPGASFLGEEGGDRQGESSLGWILDPIDGTVNLMYDLPVISVSLAATVDGTIVAGVVVDVWRHEVFGAARGTGARLDGLPIRPSGVATLGEALVATGFAYAADVRAVEAGDVARILPVARDVRGFGSTALHLCWVACGRLDAYYQRGLKVWDYAAGALIAAEARARLAWPTPGNGHLMLAASPAIFDPLARLLG
jgi:myo-inositol-1(or 4)-monophosphatase